MGAKTFSRARIVGNLRTDYHQMVIHREIMTECMSELQKHDGQNKAYYDRRLIESSTQYRERQHAIKTWCVNLGISPTEIDPSCTL